MLNFIYVLYSRFAGMTYRIIALLCLLMCSIRILAQPVTVNHINYQLMPNGKAIVVEGKYEGHITIPETIKHQNKQYSVEKIGYSAFNASPNLFSVKLPGSIHTIEKRAFGDCKALKEINIPASVTRIEGAVFYRCSNLKSIHIPLNVAYIGAGAFSRCENLTSVEVDKDNLYFASVDGVLYDKDLKTLIKLPDTRSCYVFPSTITSFLSTAFEGNSNIISIELPDAVQNIPGNAFEDCSSLKVFKIPANIVFIGMSAFMRCSAMESFHVEERNKNFSSLDGVLYNFDKTILIKCPEKKAKVQLAERVQEIDAYAFAWCKQLAEVTLPESVTKIGMSAFVQSELKTLKILSKKQVEIRDEIFAGRKKEVIVLVPEALIPIYKSSNSLAVKELNYQALK